MNHISDTPAATLIAWQAFGGGRAAGANDTTGSPWRTASGQRALRHGKSTLRMTYPYMGPRH